MRLGGLVAVVAILVTLSACGGGAEGLGCGGARVVAADLVPARYEVSELPDEALDLFRARTTARTDEDFSIDGVAVEPEQAAVYTITYEKPIGRAIEAFAGKLQDLETTEVAGAQGFVGRGNGQVFAIGKVGRCAAVVAGGFDAKPVRRVARALALGAGDARQGKPKANARRVCRDAAELKATDIIPASARPRPADRAILGAVTRSVERTYPGAGTTDGIAVGDANVITLTITNGLVGAADLEALPGRPARFAGHAGRVQRTQGITATYAVTGCSFVIVVGQGDREVRRLASRLRL